MILGFGLVATAFSLRGRPYSNNTIDASKVLRESKTLILSGLRLQAEPENQSSRSFGVSRLQYDWESTCVSGNTPARNGIDTIGRMAGGPGKVLQGMDWRNSR